MTFLCGWVHACRHAMNLCMCVIAHMRAPWRAAKQSLSESIILVFFTVRHLFNFFVDLRVLVVNPENLEPNHFESET